MSKFYTEAEVKKLAQKGRDDPASLTPDELRLVCLYAHHVHFDLLKKAKVLQN
jgi:hypothetical protein